MANLPIGWSNFQFIRENDCDYIDKTRMVDDVLRSKYSVHLFTRPRRFGKSLSLSVMDCYLNMKYEGNTWFDGLEVTDIRPDDPEKNSYPVVKINLSHLYPEEDCFEDSVRTVVSDMYDDHPYLEKSDKLSDSQRSLYDRLVMKDGSMAEMRSSLRTMTEMLETHHGRKAVVIVDEYDNVVNDCPDPVMRRRIVGFLKGFMSEAFKDNDSLRLGVIAGIMQVSREGLFAGLNNVKIDSVLSNGFGESFGFTEDEAKRLLAEHGCSDKLEEVLEMYGGYVFGGSDVCNPWSILNYISEKCKPNLYWAGGSGSELMVPLMEQDGAFDDLSVLVGGGSLEKRIDPRITYADLDSGKDALFQIMAMTGYLRTEPIQEDLYRISLPNREIRKLMDSFVPLNRPHRYEECILDLQRAFRADDRDGVEKSLGELFLKYGSFRILKRESDYRNLLYGIMVGTLTFYEPSIECEAGEGYCDLRLRSLDPGYPNIVMELKHLDGDSPDGAAESAADRALEQISSRKYASGLPGRTTAYGVAFRSKTPVVRMERLRTGL